MRSQTAIWAGVGIPERSSRNHGYTVKIEDGNPSWSGDAVPSLRLRWRIRIWKVAAAARCGNRVFGDQPSRRRSEYITLTCAGARPWEDQAASWCSKQSNRPSTLHVFEDAGRMNGAANSAAFGSGRELPPVIRCFLASRPQAAPLLWRPMDARSPPVRRAECARRSLNVCGLGLRRGIARVDEEADDGGARYQLTQQFQPFCPERGDDESYTRDIAAGTIETGDETDSDRIGAGREHDRDARIPVRRCAVEETYHRHRRLLRARNERPRRRPPSSVIKSRRFT
jgi:hypothetical protein